VIGCNQFTAGKVGNRAGQLQDTVKSSGLCERPGRGHGWWRSFRPGACRRVSRSRREGLRRGCRCARGGATDAFLVASDEGGGATTFFDGVAVESISIGMWIAVGC